MEMMIPKNNRMCIPKKIRIERDPEAWKIYLKALDEYRERRKYVRHMKMKPFLDYLNPAKRKIDFIQFCEELEDLRCRTLGMTKNRFYKLAAEFSLVLNQRAYYNPKNLFGCDSSWDSDEFKSRLFETMYNISYAVALGSIGKEDVRGTMKFIAAIDALNTVVEVRSCGILKSKDWFCVVAFRNRISQRGWTEDEALRRIKIYYRRNVKKVYPERLLNDLVKGEFDRLGLPPKKMKNPVIQTLQGEPYFKGWADEHLF